MKPLRPKKPGQPDQKDSTLIISSTVFIKKKKKKPKTKEYSCNFCNKCFYDESGLNNHEKTHFKYVYCTLCKIEKPSKNNLKTPNQISKHLSSEHQDIKTNKERLTAQSALKKGYIAFDPEEKEKYDNYKTIKLNSASPEKNNFFNEVFKKEETKEKTFAEKEDHLFNEVFKKEEILFDTDDYLFNEEIFDKVDSITPNINE